MNISDVVVSHTTQEDELRTNRCEVETTTTTAELDPKSSKVTKYQRLSVALTLGAEYRSKTKKILDNKDWLATLRDRDFKVRQGYAGIKQTFYYFHTEADGWVAVDYSNPTPATEGAEVKIWTGYWSDFVEEFYDTTPAYMRKLLGEAPESKPETEKKAECKRCGHSCPACRVDEAEAEAEAEALAEANADEEAEAEADEDEEPHADGCPCDDCLLMYGDSSEDAEAEAEADEEYVEGCEGPLFDEFVEPLLQPTQTVVPTPTPTPTPVAEAQQPTQQPAATSTNVVLGSPVVRCLLDLEKFEGKWTALAGEFEDAINAEAAKYDIPGKFTVKYSD